MGLFDNLKNQVNGALGSDFVSKAGSAISCPDARMAFSSSGLISTGFSLVTLPSSMYSFSIKILDRTDDIFLQVLSDQEAT